VPIGPCLPHGSGEFLIGHPCFASSEYQFKAMSGLP
jgi:hypothetical protein